MNKISAKIILDSRSKLTGDRITTVLLTYPRFIHSELMTHRVFSRNSASSRAIPLFKMIESVEKDPFIPTAWQKKHSGMQGNSYIEDPIEIEKCVNEWLKARDKAVEQAKILDSMNVTKQICNRILEPFLWHTVLVTSTDFSNFFNLRNPEIHVLDRGPFMSKADAYSNSNNEEFKQMCDFTLFDWLKADKSQAEIHIKELSECIYDEYNKSKPIELEPGDWHVPFGDKMDFGCLKELLPNIAPDSLSWELEHIEQLRRCVSVARCARLSYMTFDNEINYEKDLELYKVLKERRHASPFEHVCQAMNNSQLVNNYICEDGIVSYGKNRNFSGFISLRAKLKI